MSLATVGLAEVGDRSMFLALLLGLRKQRLLPIFFGMSLGVLANIALAGAIGVVLFSWFEGSWHQWLMGLVFIGMGIWMLLPEEADEVKSMSNQGAFWGAALLFFVSEMADKTQLAVVALAGNFQSFLPVVLGGALGLLLVTGPALWFGHRFAERLPIKLIQRLGAVVFFSFGIFVLAQAAS